MKNISVGNAADEIQYRLARLKKAIPKLNGRRIVVYGTGVNAKRVIDCLEALDISGLMDQEYTGKYIYGKKVLAEDEVQLLGVDTIIIAAEPRPTEIIYKRILTFCMENHISVFDMYGCDERLLHKNILEQELIYADLKENEIKKSIDSYDVLLFSFKNVLCSEIISDEAVLYEKIEERLKAEGINVPNFKRNRIMAQKRVPFGTNVNRKEIYRVLSAMLTADEKELERIRKTEEKITLSNLVPRTEVIELLQYAISQGKEIYIYSDITDAEKMVDSFLQQYGVYRYKKILADNGMLEGLLGRTIRALGGVYGYDRILCFGNDRSDNLIIPQLYQVDFQLILSSYDMFLKNTVLQIDREFIEKSPKRDEIIKEVVRAYNSPFLCQVDIVLHDNAVAEKIGWNEQEGKADIEVFPMEQWKNPDAVEKLEFPETEAPLVSVIIPAYNQFAYTYNCLKALLLNTDHVPYEVIVADDCSYDWTSRLEEIVSGITVLHNDKNVGFIKNAANAAKAAKAENILFLNNDTQVQLNWLYPLVRCMETGKDVGLAGAKLVYPDGSLQEAGSIMWNDGKAWNYGNGKNPDSPEYNYVRETDYISGAAIMIKKELWNDIGGFDERYVPAYYDDADLAYEVRKKGKRVVYQPDSVVVHFEGISNGKITDSGIKKYQKRNQALFFEKWKQQLLQEQYPEGEHLLAASERKQKRRTVLFVSEHIPTYDKDAGSRTLDFYIQEFLYRGYIVKFIPDNFIPEEPYTHRLQQMGVEVLSGKYYQKMIMNWICIHHNDIDFAFLNYPNASRKYIDVLKKYGIPVMYYGVDLHYLRLQREFELSGKEEKAEEAKIFYGRESYLIKNSDVVYYPSAVEVDIVKKEFHKEKVRQLMINIYDTDSIRNTYHPKDRNGIMFIGGYKHAPNVDAMMWFSYHIFPGIYDRLNITFYMAGADMSADIGSIEVEGIKRLGAITDAELEEMYARVKMIVVPLRYGAGIKGKVIEALYHGIPVVTTTIGIEGIPDENGAVAIADNEADFADTVVRLYQSDNELEKMSVSGQEIIRKYYSREAAWNNIAADFI